MHTYEAADKTVANKGNGHSTIRKYTKKEAYKLALYDLSKTYFSHHADAAKTQKRYLREGGLTFSGEYKQPRDFWERLSQVNEYINYFPWTADARGAQARPFPLCDDGLIEILDKARTMEIRKLMLNMGDNARKYASPDEYAKKLQEWYENVELTRTLEKQHQKTASPNGKRKSDGGNDGSPSKKHKNGKSGKKNGKNGSFNRKEPCVHCGGNHVSPDSSCWTLDKNKDKRPAFYKKKQEKEKQQEKAVLRLVSKATNKSGLIWKRNRNVIVNVA